MDKRQKSTLQSLHIKIKDDLGPNEDLLWDKIFTNEMLHSIKAEGTPRESVYKILELLEKRGPEAFDNFVWILKENFEWVAKELDGQENRKFQRSQQGMESNGQKQQLQKKQYEDACTSPIGIIESQRKTIRDMSNPTYKQETWQCHETRHTKDETQSAMDSYNQGFNESQSETAAVTTSTNDDVENQITSKREVQSEGFEKVSETVDAADASVHDGLEESDDSSPTNEATFISVREGSSQLSHLNDADDVSVHNGLEESDDSSQTSQASFISVREGSSQLSHRNDDKFHQYQKEEMRKFYIKLNAITSENDTEDREDEFVTWYMINTETGKLINRLENSDDTKMIRKCHRLFPENDKRQPLNVCIERLFADKKYLKRTLEKKEKEEKQLFDDLLKQRGNMKKMEKTLAYKEAENDNLKTTLDNLEKDADIKLKQMEEKDAKIKELESRHLEQPNNLQTKPRASTRKGQFNYRRVSNTQGQSFRRQTSYGEPRNSLMHGDYVKPSPRNMTTAMRKAPSNRK